MISMEFFAGVAFATLSVSALVFFRLWKTTHDRFYLCFSIAMALLAIERAALVYIVSEHGVNAGETAEESSWIYFIRMIAFLAIVWAIAGKNRARESHRE